MQLVQLDASQGQKIFSLQCASSVNFFVLPLFSKFILCIPASKMITNGQEPLYNPGKDLFCSSTNTKESQP